MVSPLNKPRSFERQRKINYLKVTIGAIGEIGELLPKKYKGRGSSPPTRYPLNKVREKVAFTPIAPIAFAQTRTHHRNRRADRIETRGQTLYFVLTMNELVGSKTRRILGGGTIMRWRTFECDVRAKFNNPELKSNASLEAWALALNW